MAYRRHVGVATNGFAPRNLTVEEVRTLHHVGYPAPPDMRLPSRWQLSASGVSILSVPVPHGTWWWEEIYTHRTTLTAEERASPPWDPLNEAA
jgi:hypothetical protein